MAFDLRSYIDILSAIREDNFVTTQKNIDKAEEIIACEQMLCDENAKIIAEIEV